MQQTKPSNDNQYGKSVTKKRQRTLLTHSIFLAALLLTFSFISKLLVKNAAIPVAGHITLIIVAILIGAFLVLRLLTMQDEYERILNGKAAMIALYSTLLIAPWRYLNNLGYLPTLEAHNFLMLIWVAYLAALIRYSYK